MKRLEQAWYRNDVLAHALIPLAWLFCGLVRFRRWLFSHGVLGRDRLPVPVIVVGNITVGGSGKTPLVAWLAAFLKAQGWKPGIVSRGYGGRAKVWPQVVGKESDPVLVGDEPVLLAQSCGCPLVVGPDRPAAARRLLTYGCDVIVSDDGMQHYRLERDIEIAVLDGVRRLGNRHCLPAGPLREPPSRLQEAAFVVTNGVAAPGEIPMRLICTGALNLFGEGERRALAWFSGRTVHAVAGIGNPGRFFDMLRAEGVRPVEHAFPDHHVYQARDLEFGDDLPVLLTEKDAVKCAPFADRRLWSVSVSAELPPDFGERLLMRLKER